MTISDWIFMTDWGSVIRKKDDQVVIIRDNGDQGLAVWPSGDWDKLLQTMVISDWLLEMVMIEY